jgi:hypothetical protein
VHNYAGEIVTERPVTVQFSILQGNIRGEVVYSEKHRVTTSQSGMISLFIGSGTFKSGNIDSINWISQSYFLKVEIDITGGDNFTDLGTTQILIVNGAVLQNREEKVSPLVEEDELFIIRKYAGRFIDYRRTGPDTHDGPHLIWIKTSMGNIYGKISAYGKNCKFSPGDNLYIKRLFYAPGGISGHWIYQIENDSSAYYRCTDFQHDKKVFIENWFY